MADSQHDPAVSPVPRASTVSQCQSPVNRRHLMTLPLTPVACGSSLPWSAVAGKLRNVQGQTRRGSAAAVLLTAAPTPGPRSCQVRGGRAGRKGSTREATAGARSAVLTRDPSQPRQQVWEWSRRRCSPAVGRRGLVKAVSSLGEHLREQAGKSLNHYQQMSTKTEKGK